MGINAEMIRMVADMRRSNVLRGNHVIEIGAQDVCAAPEVIAGILSEYQFDNNLRNLNSTQAARLYESLGMTHYSSIDASGALDALTFDLNKDLRRDYQFLENFDLVTNLGTSEHCFSQYSVFKNLHDLCRPGGIMIHALTVQGNVNHGFYNYHPRFVADLAAANSYEIIRLAFTVDYRPMLIEYSLEAFKKWDSHDLLLYAVLRRTNSNEFCTPFDGMFSAANKLNGYLDLKGDPLASAFAPYLKGDNWKNTRGFETLKAPEDVIGRIFSALRARFRIWV